MKKLTDLESIKRKCVDSVEQMFYFENKSLTKKEFYKALHEAAVTDLVCAYENIDISYAKKREEPDFVVSCINETYAIEVRKVDCKDETLEDCKNNQYARWGKIREICTECEKELDSSIYNQKNIYVRTQSRLFDLNDIPDFKHIKKALIAVITGREKSNEYWADVEIFPKREILPKTPISSLDNEECIIEMEPIEQDKTIVSPTILLHGNLIMEQLTVEHIKYCITDKEKKLPAYINNLLTTGYSPTQYWLILDIPNELAVNYDFKNYKVQSNFDRIYLVDIYYKQQILRLK